MALAAMDSFTLWGRRKVMRAVAFSLGVMVVLLIGRIEYQMISGNAILIGLKKDSEKVDHAVGGFDLLISHDEFAVRLATIQVHEFL